MKSSTCASCIHNLGFQPSKSGIPSEVLCDLNCESITPARFGECQNYEGAAVRRPVFQGMAPLKVSGSLEAHRSAA